MLDAQSRSRVASLVASLAHPDASRLAWLRHPELWVALALGGLLRFIWLDHAMWLSDQNDLLDLARTAVTRGVIPVTGIRASIGTLNHPLSVYILLPVAAVTPSPLAQTIILALWNVLGIALVYLASLRGFGRGVARWATLLFATCTATVQYSHFVWQQNYIAPLLALWLLCLFAGVIRSARGWLASAAALGLAAAMLHPTALGLLPVLVVAALLAPRLPSRHELATVAGLGLLGVLPTLVWESLSHGYDINALRAYLATPGRLDLDVLVMMPRAFGDALGTDSLGSGTLAAHWQALGTVLGFAMTVLILGGTGYLGWRAVGRITRAMPPTPMARRLRVWRGLLAAREDERWRVEAVLLLAIVLPIFSMFSHRSSIYPHYLIVEYPAAFLVVGVLAEAAVKRMRPTRLMAARGLVWAGMVALMLAGALDSLVYFASIDGPGFRADVGWGYSIAQARMAADRLTAISAHEGVRDVEVLANLAGGRLDLARVLSVNEPQRTILDPACLVLPAPGTSDVLAVTESDADPLSPVLRSAPWAYLVGVIPMRGADPLRIYRVSAASLSAPGAPATSPPIDYAGAAPLAVRLEGTQAVSGTITWWQVRGNVPSSGVYGPRRWLRVGAAMPCAPRAWQTGQTLLTWQPGAGGAVARVSTGLSGPLITHWGPFQLLSFLPVPEQAQSLTPIAAP